MMYKLSIVPLKVGMTIHCRILSVNIEKFSVDLSCRSSDLADKQGRFRSAVWNMLHSHSHVMSL